MHWTPSDHALMYWAYGKKTSQWAYAGENVTLHIGLLSTDYQAGRGPL